jgi:hypothetical protein
MYMNTGSYPEPTQPAERAPPGHPVPSIARSPSPAHPHPTAHTPSLKPPRATPRVVSHDSKGAESGREAWLRSRRQICGGILARVEVSRLCFEKCRWFAEGLWRFGSVLVRCEARLAGNAGVDAVVGGNAWRVMRMRVEALEFSVEVIL